MPNHVRNVWKIKGIKPEDINYILNKIAKKYMSVGAKEKDYIIDFDLIVPEPRFKKDCPKECLVNKNSHIMEDKDRPWFDWYTWHNNYWGTKWNAYDGYTKVGKTQLTFVFSTAWNCPLPVLRKLTKLGYDLEVRYADEDIGSNCGKLIYDASEHKWDIKKADELSDAVAFANNVWKY